MASTRTLKTKGGTPFAAEDSGAAASIMKDLQGRSGAIKVAECDSDIVLDAEALTVCPDSK